jgi:Tol biopolymer transport system component
LSRLPVIAVAVAGVCALAARAAPPPAPTSIVFLRDDRVFYMAGDGTRVMPAGLPYRLPRWSPRGRYMAYTVPVSNGRWHERLYVADRSGRRLRRQPVARSECLGDVAWSPDETRLVYANYCDFDFSEVLVVGRDSRGRHKLLARNWQIKPRWSPDGRMILFGHHPTYGRRAGPWWLYIVRPDGRGLRRLRNSSLQPDNNVSWDFSRDGRRVFFVTFGSLNVLNIATGARRAIAPSLQVHSFSESPDGRQLAIQAEPLVPGPREPRDWEIYTLIPDGSELRQLTQNVEQDHDPTWAPNGQRILFSSERDGNSEIYVMNADGSGQTNLTRHPAADESPAWVPPRR